MSKVSVCMATYNGAKFIKSQIASILPQLGQDDEIIISDDSSNDDTLDIIWSFNDARIKIFSQNNFKNPAHNFGNAIDKAMGDYIFLCDQDDVWMDNKVEKMVQALTYSDLVVSDCVVVDEFMHVVQPSFFLSRNSGGGFLKNFYKNSFMGCCMAFRKNLIKDILPIPSIFFYEHDWWIGLMALSSNKKVVFLKDRLMLYVRHGENFSLTASGKSLSLKVKIKNRLRMFKELFARQMLRINVFQ